jgi:hypothetical protein
MWWLRGGGRRTASTFWSERRHPCDVCLFFPFLLPVTQSIRKRDALAKLLIPNYLAISYNPHRKGRRSAGFDVLAEKDSLCTLVMYTVSAVTRK